jgi:hypothetical protein
VYVLQATERVGELERKKTQELAAWEQTRSELVSEATGLQAKLSALAETEQCEVARSAALTARVAILQDFVVACRSEFASIMSATQEWGALVAIFDEKNQGIKNQKHALEGVVAEAGRVCGQAAAELAAHIVHMEELELTVHSSS